MLAAVNGSYWAVHYLRQVRRRYGSLAAIICIGGSPTLPVDRSTYSRRCRQYGFTCMHTTVHRCSARPGCARSSSATNLWAVRSGRPPRETAALQLRGAGRLWLKPQLRRCFEKPPHPSGCDAGYRDTPVCGAQVFDPRQAVRIRPLGRSDCAEPAAPVFGLAIRHLRFDELQVGRFELL